MKETLNWVIVKQLSGFEFRIVEFVYTQASAEHFAKVLNEQLQRDVFKAIPISKLKHCSFIMEVYNERVV